MISWRKPFSERSQHFWSTAAINPCVPPKHRPETCQLPYVQAKLTWYFTDDNVPHHYRQAAKVTMVMGVKKASKAPDLRNQAVQVVGERYFQLALAGLVIAGILGIVAVSIGAGSKTGL